MKLEIKECSVVGQDCSDGTAVLQVGAEKSGSLLRSSSGIKWSINFGKYKAGCEAGHSTGENRKQSWKGKVVEMMW